MRPTFSVSTGDMGDNQVRLLFLQIQVGYELVHVCILTSRSFWPLVLNALRYIEQLVGSTVCI